MVGMTSAHGPSKSTTWIIVANQSEAQFYSRDKKNSPLQRVSTMEADAGQKKAGELTSDRDGRSFDSHGQGRHAFSKEKTGPKQHEAEIFANRIASRIITAKQQGDFSELVLIAAPRFLGTLRKSLSVSHGTASDRDIDKDVVGQDIAVVEKLLAE